MQKYKIKQYIFRILGSVALLIAIMGVFETLLVLIDPSTFFENSGLVRQIVIIAVLTIIGIGLWTSDFAEEKKEKITSIIIKILFGLYVVALITVLFGTVTIPIRDKGETGALTIGQFMQQANFVPFKTIIGYIRAYFYDTVPVSDIIWNLVGNFILFMPMVYFLYCFFEKFRKKSFFCISMFALLIVVEFLQMIMSRGYCDIDDVILNFSGMIVAYWLLNCVIIKKWLVQVNLLQEKKNIVEKGVRK